VNILAFEMLDALHRGERPPIPEEMVCTQLRELMLHCWAHQPEKRPSADALRKQLLAIPSDFMLWRTDEGKGKEKLVGKETEKEKVEKEEFLEKEEGKGKEKSRMVSRGYSNLTTQETRALTAEERKSMRERLRSLDWEIPFCELAIFLNKKLGKGSGGEVCEGTWDGKWKVAVKIFIDKSLVQKEFDVIKQMCVPPLLRLIVLTLTYVVIESLRMRTWWISTEYLSISRAETVM